MTPPGAAAAAPAVHPRQAPAPARRRTAPARPRRVSGPSQPARSRPRARPARRPQRVDGGLLLGLLGLLDRLSSHRILDRLVRGRASIALVAFALIGIVTLQLGLLKLNSSIGRTLERESVLQRENAALSIQNSELAAGERVQARATQLGMALVPVAAFRFLSADPRVDATRAVTALRTPVHASGGESGEAGTPAAGTSASGGEATAEQAATPASESSSSSEASSATPSQTGTQAGTTSGQPASAPESSSTRSSPSSSSASGGGEAAADAGEATPAGGTQAGPTG